MRARVAVALLLAACGGSDARVEPVVGLIPEAMSAVEAHYGAPQQFFEVSADLDAVGFVVALDGATTAEQGSYDAVDGLTVPTPVGEASGATFASDAIDFDSDRIFDQIRQELDDPAIIDFAIQGGPDGTVVYDATIASSGGGVLIVLLGADGRILGAQGR